MAAISALVAYGSDSSEGEGDPKTVTEDMTLHLKPLGSGATVNTVKEDMQVVAAPVVATKVCVTF